MNPIAIAQRINTVLGSLVTYLTGLAVATTALINQVTPALPDGWQDNALGIGGTVAAWLLAAAAAIRRVTEVPEGERGLLPAPGRSHVPPN